LVDRALRGDPETIIAKALAKEASHRYQSAYDFAADIRRFLTDEPILARPPGGFYRLGKFARRHRAAAVASLLVLWALLLGIAGTSWQAWQARRQAEKAAHNQRWLQEMLKHIDPGWMNLRNVHELERSLSETAQTLSRTEPLHWSEFDADLSETLGLLYKSLERYDAAEHHLSLAYLTYENVLGSDHPQTLAALHNLGALYTVQERDLEAESWLRLALERRGRVLGEENRDTMETMMVLGKTLHHQQRFAEAEALFTEAVQHCRRDPASDGAATMIAMHCLGFVMRAQGKSAEAEPWLCAAYEWGASRLPRWNLLTLMSQREYGSCLADLGRYEDAEAYLLGAYQNLVNTTGAADVRTIYALNHVVELYEAWGKPEEAARYRRLLTAQEESP
jgi:tetratricopeptide (TPR) repeat protein